MGVQSPLPLNKGRLLVEEAPSCTAHLYVKEVWTAVCGWLPGTQEKMALGLFKNGLFQKVGFKNFRWLELVQSHAGDCGLFYEPHTLEAEGMCGNLHFGHVVPLRQRLSECLSNAISVFVQLAVSLEVIKHCAGKCGTNSRSS